MKKLIFFIAILSILMGCKKASYVAKFDESPQQRASDQIGLVSTTLTSAPNGWIATLSTGAGGGYSFFMIFDNNQNVTMYSDMTDKSATESAKSYYRVKQDIGTDLVFDSYNYISMLNDPDAAVLGGASKLGYNSDNDFTYDRSTTDSIVFIGKKFRQPFKLVKATAAQKASYEAAELKKSIDKIKTYFASNSFPYIDIVSGQATLKAGVSLNSTNNLAAGKRITFTGVAADGTTPMLSSVKFAFKLDGADLLIDGLVYNGISFVKMAWKDATTLAFYDNTGKEYIVKNSTVPLVPFISLFKYNGTYKRIVIGGTAVLPGGALLPVGVNSGFNAVYQTLITKLKASTRTLVTMHFALTNSTTATLTISPNNGTTTFLATATYNYSINGDVITLSNPVYDGNWTARASEYSDIQSYFLSGPFKMDWVTSSDPSNKSIMGGLYRVADAASFFYGIAQ